MILSVRHKTTSRVGTVLALAAMLFVTLGMYALHPWVHPHDCACDCRQSSSGACDSGERPGTIVVVSKGPEQGPCPICELLSNFHVDNQNLGEFDVADVLVTVRALLPISIFPQKHPGAIEARAPPL